MLGSVTGEQANVRMLQRLQQEAITWSGLEPPEHRPPYWVDYYSNSLIHLALVQGRKSKSQLGNSLSDSAVATSTRDSKRARVPSFSHPTRGPWGSQTRQHSLDRQGRTRPHRFRVINDLGRRRNVHILSPRGRKHALDGARVHDGGSKVL